METMVVRAAEATFTVVSRTPTQNSKELLDAIYQQLGAASLDEIRLEHSWMKLGALLRDCKAGEHWRAAGFRSFETFMGDLGERYKRGKTQLWAYLTVAEHLSPLIDATTLEEIGISKAMEIRRQLKKFDGQKKLTPELIEAAKRQSTTIKELRGLFAQAFNAPDDRPAGTWFDFDGCFFTKEEREEFVAAVRMTKTLLGIANHIPEHIQRKEIFTAWMREFIGTHTAEVYGPPAEEVTVTPARLLPAKPSDTDGWRDPAP